MAAILQDRFVFPTAASGNDDDVATGISTTRSKPITSRLSIENIARIDAFDGDARLSTSTGDEFSAGPSTSSSSTSSSEAASDSAPSVVSSRPTTPDTSSQKASSPSLEDVEEYEGPLTYLYHPNENQWTSRAATIQHRYGHQSLITEPASLSASASVSSPSSFVSTSSPSSSVRAFYQFNEADIKTPPAVLLVPPRISSSPSSSSSSSSSRSRSHSKSTSSYDAEYAFSFPEHFSTPTLRASNIAYHPRKVRRLHPPPQLYSQPDRIRAKYVYDSAWIERPELTAEQAMLCIMDLELAEVLRARGLEARDPLPYAMNSRAGNGVGLEMGAMRSRSDSNSGAPIEPSRSVTRNERVAEGPSFSQKRANTSSYDAQSQSRPYAHPRSASTPSLPSKSGSQTLPRSSSPSPSLSQRPRFQTLTRKLSRSSLSSMFSSNSSSGSNSDAASVMTSDASSTYSSTSVSSSSKPMSASRHIPRSPSPLSRSSTAVDNINEGKPTGLVATIGKWFS